MKTATKIKLAWRYRGFLWKYRALIRRRRQIAAVAGAAVAVVAGKWVYDYATRNRDASLITREPA